MSQLEQLSIRSDDGDDSDGAVSVASTASVSASATSRASAADGPAPSSLAALAAPAAAYITDKVDGKGVHVFSVLAAAATPPGHAATSSSAGAAGKPASPSLAQLTVQDPLPSYEDGLDPKTNTDDRVKAAIIHWSSYVANRKASSLLGLLSSTEWTRDKIATRHAALTAAQGVWSNDLLQETLTRGAKPKLGDVEALVAKYAEEYKNMCVPLRKHDLEALVLEVAATAGVTVTGHDHRSLVDGLMRRHGLAMVTAEPIELARVKAADSDAIKWWFETIYTPAFNSIGGDPRRIVNMDETLMGESTEDDKVSGGMGWGGGKRGARLGCGHKGEHGTMASCRIGRSAALTLPCSPLPACRPRPLLNPHAAAAGGRSQGRQGRYNDDRVLGAHHAQQLHPSQPR
jgi:hypothetical protein